MVKANILVAAGGDVAPKTDFDLVIWNGAGKMPQNEIVARRGIEGVVVGDEPWTAELMDAMLPYLRILYRCGNGWDNIDREAAAERGIEVKRVDGAYAGPVADSTVGLILALARRIIALNQSMKSGNWERERYPGVAMQDITVGIIGYGNIGREVHRRLSGFPCKVLVHRPEHNGPFSVSLDTLLAQSDFVTLHLALNKDTHYFIGPEEIAKMKPGSYLINTSRGGLINTNALVDALNKHQIGGAALDAFEEEPLPTRHPLRNMDNVILSPHNTYWSPSERQQVVMQAIDGTKEWLSEQT